MFEELSSDLQNIESVQSDDLSIHGADGIYDFFHTNEQSARSILASAARYYGEGKSWSTFFPMVFEIIKFAIEHPVTFWRMWNVRDEIFYPEFKPEKLTKLLENEYVAKFLQKKESQQALETVVVGLRSLTPEARELLQGATSAMFDIISTKGVYEEFLEITNTIAAKNPNDIPKITEEFLRLFASNQEMKNFLQKKS